MGKILDFFKGLFKKEEKPEPEPIEVPENLNSAAFAVIGMEGFEETVNECRDCNHFLCCFSYGRWPMDQKQLGVVEL